ncbi:hypothetical protein COOONC_26199 [Cooperia oncophora]
MSVVAVKLRWFLLLLRRIFTQYRGENTSCYYPGLPVQGYQYPLRLFPSGSFSKCITITALKIPICRRSLWKPDQREINGCPSDEEVKEFLVSDISHVCNCGTCKTPLLR